MARRRPRRPGRGLLVALAVALLLPAGAATAHASTTSGYFAGDDSSPHESDIEALAAAGITSGCGIGVFCHGAPVTRGQMAAFVTRAFDLPPASADWFTDDGDSIFEDAIDRMREAELTSGCNPPANDHYCPDAPVTRAQMAVFLGEAMQLPPDDSDWFVDDDGSMFEEAIDAFAAGGVTRGCNPPANDHYCPDASVTRGQMATFLTRARGLQVPAGASDRMHPVVLRWGDLELRTPSSGTELVGLHQSNHEGARDLSPTGALPGLVMESRGRGTGRRTAADVVAHPEVEVRAPVTGTVKRAGTYTLYCRYSDDYLVIEPDGMPGFEVKLLHIDGVRQSKGDRVEAGVTVVARRPTVLPFASQVDDHSGPRDWPHVHMELVDTSIPNEPSPGGGC